MHAEIVVGTGLVMLAEPPTSDGAFPPASTPSSVGIMVQLATAADVERLHERAVAAGGRSQIARRHEPWGVRLAGIADPSGHRWWLHAPFETATGPKG